MITQHEMARLVAAWEAGRDSTLTPRAQAMIEAEVARVKRAYSKMPIRVKFVDHDPYSSFEQMRDQVQSTGTMLVWTGASDTPLWDAQTNWQARAVHDYDHIVKSLDFSMEGEAATARHSAARMPGLAPMYISEIMLQAAVNNYTGKFVPQKLVLLSEQDERFATQLRGAGAEPTDAAQLVWETAGVLRVGSPESAMLHLGAAGVGVREATIILEAAQALNAKSETSSSDKQHERGSGKMRAVKIAEGKGGARYAIATMRNSFGRGEGYSVWVERKNYNGNVRSGVQTTWRYVARDLTLPAAEALFARRTKGV